MVFSSKSEKETFGFGQKFSRRLKGGEIIGLVGDLGAGKTVFVRGLASGLGIRQKITSPTFVFMKNYLVGKQAIKELVHIDAYRIKRAADMDEIGIKDYLCRQDAVVVIEWAEKIKKIMPGQTKFLFFNIKNNHRLIKF
jgi:tRNA threonylcarbamoyladenosine biosynthesis protein TsaE